MSESVNPQELNPADRSLRKRLAEVIGNTSCIATDLEVADAVIAELGLHPAESLDRRFIRWVTAWRNNPEMGLADDE